MARKRVKTGVQGNSNYDSRTPKFNYKKKKPKYHEESYPSPKLKLPKSALQKRDDSREHELYNRQMRRVRSFVYRAKKRGYTFPEDMIPKRPKEYTMKDVEQLANMTPNYMYSQAKVFYNDEGEYYTGLEYRHMENVARGRKAYETRYFRQFDKEQTKQPVDYDIVQRVRQLIENSHPTEDWSNYSPHQKQALLMLFDEQESYLDGDFPDFLRSIETEFENKLNVLQNYNRDNNEKFQELMILLNGGPLPSYLQDRVDDLESEFRAWEI